MNKQSLVSVIIPAYYSNETIADCLESLLHQTYQDFETIVVNSSPEEKTGELVRKQFPKVRFFQSPQRLYPHAARNRGIEASKGELLVFTDPDCTYEPDWLDRIVDACRDGDGVAVGSMGHRSKSWFENGVHLTKFFELLPGLPAGLREVAPTANAAYARSVWEKLGPFDGTIFTGDAVQSWKASQENIPIRFEPTAIVYHRHEGHAASFWKERETRGIEFILQRIRFYHWSHLRCLAYMTLMPIRFFHVLVVRTGYTAYRAGWGSRYIWTFPIQFVGQLAWTLGEAKGCWRFLIRKLP